jgi:septal ring factor EnvC (AmiA/AmiB activator)
LENSLGGAECVDALSADLAGAQARIAGLEAELREASIASQDAVTALARVEEELSRAIDRAAAAEAELDATRQSVVVADEAAEALKATLSAVRGALFHITFAVFYRFFGHSSAPCYLRTLTSRALISQLSQICPSVVSTSCPD